MWIFMTGFRPASSLRGAKRRGAQGSAACGLRATAASGGGKGAKKVGSHLVLRKQSVAQNLSGNPEESSDRSGWAGACVCANNVRRKCLATTWKSASHTLRFSERFRENDPCKGKRIATPVCALARNDSVFLNTCIIFVVSYLTR